MEGKYCVIEILDIEKHADDLFNSFAKDAKNYDWTYLHYGGFKSLREFKEWLNKDCIDNSDPRCGLFYNLLQLAKSPQHWFAFFYAFFKTYKLLRNLITNMI